MGVSLANTNCTNPTDWRKYLPPVEYQHEPYMAFKWADKKMMLAIAGVFVPGYIAYGHYGISSKNIYICRGLTGNALRAIRMHEEAHAMGWRHPNVMKE